MFNDHKHETVESRNEKFVEQTATKIWLEVPSQENPYIAESAYCFGYDVLELMEKRSFVDVFYLLFKGELPSQSASKLLELLMIALINPGPRHPATRAAMNAGVGKSLPQHILPIGLSVMGGEYLGVGAMESAMRFIRANQKCDPCAVYEAYIEPFTTVPLENADKINTIIPGLGRVYGGIDRVVEKISKQMVSFSDAGSSLKWVVKLAEQLSGCNVGLLPSGLAAAVFSDLGFHPKSCAVLFQLMSAPGIAAHGLEISNKPITAMPFVPDNAYFIER